MEINPGASMTVNGRVHSNYNIWATGSSSGSPLDFNGTVDASGFVTNSPSLLDPQNYRIAWQRQLCRHQQPGIQRRFPDPAHRRAPPTIIPSMSRPSSNLPPDDMAAPLPAAYSTNGQVYLYNEADLIISNSPSGINGDSSTNVLTVLYQNPNRATPLAVVTPDLAIHADRAHPTPMSPVWLP